MHLQHLFIHFIGACSDPAPFLNDCGLNPVTRYYYNSANSQCSVITWRGCGTSRNNFLTLQSCQTLCENTGDTV